MNRHQTSEEQNRFRKYFQNLFLNQTIVSGEPSIAYNSVAWAFGLNNRWIWPGNTLEDFDVFFDSLGYMKTSAGPVAVFGHSTREITHLCALSQPDGKIWESKCGADLRIQHHLNELGGNTYGRLLGFYKPDALKKKVMDGLMSIQINDSSCLIKEAKEIIKEETVCLPRRTLFEFEKLFENWRNSWFAGRLAINSGLLARTHSFEFFKLTKMGEKTIPLILHKMLDSDNVFAIQLYEAVQRDNNLKVPLNANTALLFEGEQGRTIRTIDLYVKHKQLSYT